MDSYEDYEQLAESDIEDLGFVELLAEYLRQSLIDEELSGTVTMTMLNSNVVRDMYEVQKLLELSLRPDMEVSSEIKYTSGYGIVWAEASRIDILNPELFRKIWDIHHEIDIYPKTNGLVRITFTFNNLMGE